MNDPIWDKVRELGKGYSPYFNASTAYDLVVTAWKMGFDVVPDPNGPERLRAAQAAIAREMQTARETIDPSAMQQGSATEGT
jgi:hypothetical protein